MPLPLRSRIEHASVPLIERLQKIPRPLFLLLSGIVVATGVFAPRPFGGIAFLVMAALLGWFLFLTWPKLQMPERLLRFAILALVVAVGVTRVV